MLIACAPVDATYASSANAPEEAPIETIAEINSVIKKYNFNDVDVVQIAVSKAKKAGDYNILQGQNPVYIATFTL